MARPSEKALRYQETARGMFWPEIQMLWEHVKADDTPDWDQGKALEHLVARGFELSDLDVEYPCDVPPAGDPLEQIDRLSADSLRQGRQPAALVDVVHRTAESLSPSPQLAQAVARAA